MLYLLLSVHLLRGIAHGGYKSGWVSVVGVGPGEVSRTSVCLLYPGALATTETEVYYAPLGLPCASVV